jgi:hypothetical protein
VRSVRAAHASQDQHGAGCEIRRVIGARRAAPWQEARHGHAQ